MICDVAESLNEPAVDLIRDVLSKHMESVLIAARDELKYRRALARSENDELLQFVRDFRDCSTRDEMMLLHLRADQLLEKII